MGCSNMDMAITAVECEIEELEEKFKEELRLRKYQNNIGMKAPTRPTPVEIKISELNDVITKLRQIDRT